MKDDSQPTFALPGDNNPHNDAANLIRSKLTSLYAQAPDAVTVSIESVQEEPKERSKHQRFMADLAASGKPFAHIQTEWHDYYTALPDKEKHEVWNEFYHAQEHKPTFASQAVQPAGPQAQASSIFAADFSPPPPVGTKAKRPQSIAELKKQITSKVQTRGKLSRKQHLKSLGFGVGAGAFTMLLLLFGFFNERFIAPFVSPSKTVSSSPLIAGSNTPVGSDPKLIIPKINVELPVVYDVETVEEAAVQEGLERGVVHYATTSNPGEQGNGAIFGHSSNNILNRGQYKFAFVLLSRLENDDTFYLEKNGVRYVYRVFKKEIVSPSQVEVLGDVPGKTSTMALITCDPPGTTINRLVVWGEQISPDPSSNIASTAIKTDHQPPVLAGNAPSLWSRIWNGIF